MSASFQEEEPFGFLDRLGVLLFERFQVLIALGHARRAFGRLREMGTLVPARLPLMGKMWLVTTYDAVNDVLKNDKLFCRDHRNAGRSKVSDASVVDAGPLQAAQPKHDRCG